MSAEWMDPRQRRTRVRLHKVIHELATTMPLDSITMADIARAAEVKRDTVYRHAGSAVALLVQALEAEVEDLVVLTSQLPALSLTGESVFAGPEVSMFQHVAEHAEIYRNALSSEASGPIRDMLIEASARALTAHLQRHPDIAPLVNGRPATESERRMFVAFAAAGTFGAMREWLFAGDLTDLEAAAAATLAAAPEWWMGRG
ncbi:TetR/AcrR family transcriptional regulator [Mycetocola zhadangensis]|uniref:TetR/AcrR family transcriptional regulator n=1 Tax=Mycetocola zhadangensis TaxID=1164595 RepID=UPI003A4E1D4F